MKLYVLANTGAGAVLYEFETGFERTDFIVNFLLENQYNQENEILSVFEGCMSFNNVKKICIPEEES